MKKAPWGKLKELKAVIAAITAITAITTTHAEETKQLFWKETELIQKMNLDGSEQDTVLDGHNIVGIDVDTKNGNIYWWDKFQKRLCRSDIDGANQRVLFQVPTSERAGKLVMEIAIDTEGQRVYFTMFDRTPQTGIIGIQSVSFDGSDPEWLVTGLEMPCDLEIDNGKLFWTDNSSRLIESIKLDGTNRVTIHDYTGTYKNIYGISLDPENECLYYSNSRNGNVEKVHYDGSGHEVILTQSTTDSWLRDVEFFQGRLYISELLLNGGENHLFSTDLTGGDFQEVYVYQGGAGRYSIGADDRIYAVDPFKQEIISFDSDGKNSMVNLQRYGVDYVSGFAIDDTNKRVYIVPAYYDGDTPILFSDLDGAPLTTVVEMQHGQLRDLSVGNGKLYWINSFDHLYRSDSDGKNIERLSDTLESVNSIFVEQSEGYIYFVNADNQLLRTDLDYAMVADTLFTVDQYTRMYVYPEIGRIFYTNENTAQLISCNLNGSDAQILSSGNTQFGDVLVDKESDILYWVSDKAINSINIDGTDAKVLYTSDLGYLSYLAFGTPKEIEQSEVEKVLSCDSPLKWSINSGDITESSKTTDGNGSLAVIPQYGHSEIRSGHLKTSEITNPSKTILADLFIPSDLPNPWWVGNIQMVVRIPSAGIWYGNAGVVQLTPLSKDEWVTVSYTLPQNILDALNGDYDDLTLSFKYTVEAGDTPYLLDNIRFE